MLPTLLDIAKANGSDAVVGLVDETSKAVPEITLGAARTISGTSYKTLVRTALPTVGFRNANEGANASKGTYENRRFETYILNPRWECDKAVADAHEDGASAFIALEADGIMKASFQFLGSQFYYGIGNDAKGFPGLLASLDTTNMLVDATGAAANTGSSVWGVKFGPQFVQWVWGKEGQLALSELMTARLTDSNNKPFTGYVQEILSYVGLQVLDARCIGRISKLTAESGKGLTDSLLSQLYEKFPVGMKPDMWLMNRRSLGQLQRSRTATNATGAEAPVPEESQKVPIQVTDSIVSTEALTL